MIQDNEVWVFDDFIEKEYQEQIKNVLGYSSRGEVIHTNNMVISENE